MFIYGILYAKIIKGTLRLMDDSDSNSDNSDSENNNDKYYSRYYLIQNRYQNNTKVGFAYIVKCTFLCCFGL